MTDRITPEIGTAVTAQAAQWIDGAPRTTIRSIAGATNKKTAAMRLFFELETGAVVALDARQIDWLESNIQKTRREHASFLNDKRQL